MIKRWLEEELMNKLTYRRGVHLTGARQVGKSTLVNSIQISKCRRYTLDARNVREVALTDPNGFVKHEVGETLVIDEVQKAPELLNAIKIVLDNDNAKGQYLLTGSSNLQFAKAITDSLAGRLGHLRLRPLAWGEINGNTPSFLKRAFCRDFNNEYENVDKRKIIEIAFQGGYPEPLMFTQKERRDWFKDYLNDVLIKDIRDVTEIRKTEHLQSLAKALFAHSAQFFLLEDLATKSALSRATVQDYLEALKALYLFDQLPAWTKSDYDQLGKRPKWIATDSGMMANILGWNEEDTYLDAQKSGKFIESWVYQQIAAIASVEGTYEITHYRDNKKREIDFMVERDDGALLGIEVKAGDVTASDFKHLKWFSENLAKTSFTGIVLYSGKDVLSFGENLLAVPLSALGT